MRRPSATIQSEKQFWLRLTTVIEADYGTGHARMFVGSENFLRTSLENNRELGLISSDPAVLSAMARTFTADFRNGQHWS